MSVRVRVAALVMAGILVAGLIGVFGHVHAASTSGMVLEPSAVLLTGTPGQSIKLDVVIGDVSDVGGFTFEFLFNGTYLNVDDIRTTFFDSRAGDFVCSENILDDIAAFGCVILGKPGVSGSGVLASIDLTLKSAPPADQQLLMRNCELADSQGVPIELEGCDGAILLVPTPTPTPTPRPVGGISRDLHAEALPQATPADAGGRGVPIGVGAIAPAAAAASLAVLGCLTWRRRRRP